MLGALRLHVQIPDITEAVGHDQDGAAQLIQCGIGVAHQCAKLALDLFILGKKRVVQAKHLLEEACQETGLSDCFGYAFAPKAIGFRTTLN